MARDAAISVAYVPFKTFLTALDTLRHGIPNPIDKSLFRNQSGTTQGMLLSSMRALKVIDENGKPEPILERLVEPSSRNDALREIIQDRYASVLAIGPSASEKQFDDAIAAFGAAGDTKKKAKSFFLQAAAMASLPLSPHIAGARAVSADGEAPPTRSPATRRRRNGAKRRQDDVVPDAPTPVVTRGSSKTIQLVSGGGEVTLTVSIDPMELEDDDRDFVFDLIGKLKKYEKNGGPSPEKATVRGAADS